MTQFALIANLLNRYIQPLSGTLCGQALIFNMIAFSTEHLCKRASWFKANDCEFRLMFRQFSDSKSELASMSRWANAQIHQSPDLSTFAVRY